MVICPLVGDTDWVVRDQGIHSVILLVRVAISQFWKGGQRFRKGGQKGDIFFLKGGREGGLFLPEKKTITTGKISNTNVTIMSTS